MKQWISVALLIVSLISAGGLKEAHALQLDWSGQFWADQNWLNNYQLNRGRPGYDADPVFINNGSPYVPGVGEKNIIWYSMFMRLEPKVIVNDSINIKSEWFIGSPIFGFWGSGFPDQGDEELNFFNTQRENFTIGAQRVWANLITDFGTVEVGRAPIDWGLGAMWDKGNDLFDRYQSTGDMIRLTSKFGNFFIQPSLVKVAVGDNVGGATVSGAVTQGSDDVTDYNIALKYDNPEEDVEFGVKWTKRTGNVAQKSIFFNPNRTGSTRIDINLFDFYARKKWGRFWLGGELPLFSGDLGALDGQNEFTYKAFAIVGEGGYTSDMWDVDLKVGHVPGQIPSSVGDDKFTAIFLNRNYNLGLILFHYNLYGLSSNNPETVAAANVNSPYDSTIVNATYLSVTPKLKFDKWTFKTTLVAAFADEVAKAGQQFYNYNRRQFFSAVNNQSSFMGWEIDPGVAFKWDENFTISWDFGFFFPGDYFAFANSTVTDKFELNAMFASQVRLGVTF